MTALAECDRPGDATETALWERRTNSAPLGAAELGQARNCDSRPCRSGFRSARIERSV